MSSRFPRPNLSAFDAVATLSNDITRGMALAAKGGDYRTWDWVMQDSLVAFGGFRQQR